VNALETRPNAGVEAAHPSLELIYELAREQYHRQKARRESLVSRSSAFLGLLAVFIGLVAAAPFEQLTWRVLSALGLAATLTSVLRFVSVARLRSFTETPDIAGLVDGGYLDKAEAETRRQVLASTRAAVKNNGEALRGVESSYQWGVIFATIGAGLIGAGVVLAMFMP
jgi:hypothetical protein